MPRKSSTLRLAALLLILGAPLFAGTYWGVIGAIHNSVGLLKNKIDALTPSPAPTAPGPSSTFTISPTFSESATPLPSPTQSATVTFTVTDTDTPTISPTASSTE